MSQSATIAFGGGIIPRAAIASIRAYPTRTPNRLKTTAIAIAFLSLPFVAFAISENVSESENRIAMYVTAFILGLSILIGLVGRLISRRIYVLRISTAGGDVLEESFAKAKDCESTMGGIVEGIDTRSLPIAIINRLHVYAR